MRTLLILSSLALVVLAQAQSSSTSTATTRVRYEAPSSVRLLNLTGEQYSVHTDGSPGIYGNDQGGTVQLGHSESTTHAYDATTNTFDLSATVSASLDSTDYSAIPTDPDGAYQYNFTGYRYFVTLYNTTGQDATLSFHVTWSGTLSGNAASPFGRLAFTPSGGYTPGAYADGDSNGGVLNRSTEISFNNPPNLRSDFAGTAYSDQPGVSTAAYSKSFGDDYAFTYVLPRAQIQTFQFTASASASAQFAPVPEPAAFLPLGLGALVVMRRKRRVRP